MAQLWRKQLELLMTYDDGLHTHSTSEQLKVEKDVIKVYKTVRDRNITECVHLFKDKHITYLNRGIKNLSCHFECLDASRPWLCYWILHSLSLLKQTIPSALANNIIYFISKCQHCTGGFGGGPGQLPHLAPTYAAVLSLCILGTKEAYEVIDRASLQLFLKSMHQSDGSFIMHKDGEVDIRGAYCAVVCAVLTNIYHPGIFNNTAKWISSCQTYEGGFSAVPGTEAHGGYSFCGFATLVQLQQTSLCDIHKLMKWASCRQMKLEGGFQGRTNKLVDGCYSFWVGGLFPLMYMALREKDDLSDCKTWHFQQDLLQEYILICCQSLFGGLIDKPGKTSDYYHTCYCLSGLSISQHCLNSIVNITNDSTDIVAPVHPIYNIPVNMANQAIQYYMQREDIIVKKD